MPATSASSSQNDIVLANAQIRLDFNSDGQLLHYINCKSGRDFISPHYLCRLILDKPGYLEFEAIPEKCVNFDAKEDEITFFFDRFLGEDGNTYSIDASLTAKIVENDVHWKIALLNHTPESTVREIHYPILNVKDPQPPLSLHTSELVSTTYPDLPAMLKSEFSNYMAPDQRYIRHITAYPGMPCSLGYFLLDYETENLYYGCHDPNFMITNQVFELEKMSKVNCFMVRLPFLKPGDAITENYIVTSLLNGDWTLGAQKYRKWANTWYKPIPRNTFVEDSFGWQRVIMHHQYGEYFFSYQDLPKILEHGLVAGIDTIFLFGWTKEGMDSGYPQYSPDPACGGFDELRRNVLKVREMGGHVILYFNGQLIDAASEYYRNGDGRQVSIKRMDGNEHREFYNFSNTGTFTRKFGNKTFVVACPSCDGWKQILKEHIDQAYELGCDGVFFDQLGFSSYPCCDPSHGHPVPFIGMMNAKRALVKELYEYTKSKDPNMAFGVECPTDQTAEFCDFIHIFGNTAQVSNPGFRGRGERPLLKSTAPLFRMTFPETYLSDRDIRDDSDVLFPVNQLILLGRRSDVEIFRCRADISSAPKYQAYLKQANELRLKYKDILLHGIPTASSLHSVSDPLVLTNAFKLDDKLAVIVTQSSTLSVTAKISVPGYTMVDSASVRNDAIIDGHYVTLPCDSLAVILYKKEE